MNAEPIPDSALHVTSHEVRALLSFNDHQESPDAGAALIRTVLALAVQPAGSELVRAGLSTLHIRGMASPASR